MHDGMQCDPIQGQGQGHEPSKVQKSTIFKGYLLPPFIMGAGKWPWILKIAYRGRIFSLVFVSRDFKVGSK